MEYSAKTVCDVIHKFYPDFKIEYPTRRKYLYHLLRNNELIKQIPKSSFDLAEEKNKISYIERVQKVKTEMFAWICNQTIVTVYQYVYTPRWPNDPLHKDIHQEVDVHVTHITTDYIIIDNHQKFIMDPNQLRWIKGKCYIKYLP